MKNNWKEDFDEKFGNLGIYSSDELGILNFEVKKLLAIKAFTEEILEEQKKELLDLLEKEVGKLYKPYEGEEQIMIEHHILDEVSTIIKQLRV